MDIQEIRKVRRNSGFKDSETQRRNLVINFAMNQKQMQTLKERLDMIKFEQWKTS